MSFPWKNFYLASIQPSGFGVIYIFHYVNQTKPKTYGEKFQYAGAVAKAT